MKIKMDLLPQKFKCVRHDFLGVVLLVMVLILGSLMNGLILMGLKIRYNITERSIRRGVESSAKELEKSALKKEVLKNSLDKVSFDTEKQIRLNDEISAYNDIKRHFQWSEFFQQLELMMPKRVWIKMLDISKCPSFTLICEAADQMLLIDLEQNLILNNKYFSNVFLGDSVLDKQNLAVIFRISFDFSNGGKGS
ncbi:MAG: hypothetical protein PHQ23_08985 [Candidatus Wallbacteria bacterium]|nr:hypothetical protein [Candidatus Wallbacteria bacterium]